jgi:hypothetical protein
MSVKHLPLGRKVVFYVAGFFFWAWAFIALTSPPGEVQWGGMILLLASAGAVMAWAASYERPAGGPAPPAFPLEWVQVQEAPRQAVVSVAEPEPLPVAPGLAASQEAGGGNPPAPESGAAGVRLIVDISHPEKFHDCCLNCADRFVCYANQREVEDNYSFHCEAYQRDDRYAMGPVVDVGKGRNGAKGKSKRGD